VGDPADVTTAVMIVIACHNEEEAARAIEAISRPMTGLILDGMNITLMRSDMDDSTS
jgi:hypothetical protein